MFLALALACHRSHDDPTAEPIVPYDPLPLVDVFVGTGGAGFGVGSINPGPRRPFGMVHVGPDTWGVGGDTEFLHCAGYAYGDDRITAFSHNHAHGMGVADYGQIGLLPADGFTPALTTDQGRAIGYAKTTERGSPGFYGVTLASSIDVELTATVHGAAHRYTFPDTADPVVVIDLGHSYGSNGIIAADLRIDGATVTGYQRLAGSYSGRYGGLQAWFVATFDPPPIATGTWADPAAPIAGETAAAGAGSGAWLEFPPGVVEVRLGLSFVDGDGARANLDAELTRRSGASSRPRSSTPARCRPASPTSTGATAASTARCTRPASTTTPTSPCGTPSGRCTPG
jgi:putative alpha-1,2-mannosidase